MKINSLQFQENLSHLDEDEQILFVDIVNSIFEIRKKLQGVHAISGDELGKLAQMAFLSNETFGDNVSGLLVESKSGNFLIDKADFGVGLELRRTGAYGTFELECINDYIAIDSNVLVVGAHVGTIAIPISKRCKKVVAIEANQATYSLLIKNILLNEAANCFAFNIAASDVSGKISFLQNIANSGGSKRKPIHDDYMYNYDSPQEIIIDAEPLDSYLEGQDFEIIIMDLEGSEYFALQGMQRIVKFARVLIMEFIPHHLKNVSGVSVDEFLKLVKSFDHLTIPSKGLKVDLKNFSSVLNFMYDNNISDEGIIFEKLN